ncbi:MAG: hypothetical protein GY950_09685 [bacterium]|nr:hypothetical protein [bacterium]
MDYAKKYNGEFMKIFNTYYGDKPPYMLKDWDGLGQIINWLNILEKYKDALAYFDNYSKTRENNIAFEKNMGIFPGILTSLLYSGREKEAEAWITTLQKQAEETLGKMDKDEKEMNKMQYTYFFNSNYRTLADYYNKKGDQKKAEKYSQLISWN